MEEEPVQLKQKYEVGIVLSGMLESGVSITNQIHLAQGADRIIEAISLPDTWQERLLAQLHLEDESKRVEDERAATLLKLKPSITF